MLQHRVPIGRLLGIPIDLDYSWFLIFGLMTLMLAVNYYPAEFRHWTTPEYWFMGIVTAFLLFASVVVHELGHSLVARWFGLSVPRITLFVFGGVSEIAAEPPNAAAEFWIAIAGPMVSFALAGFFWEIERFLLWSQALFALAKYLALMNLVLGAFNLVPGFPLDGGRLFRAIIWRTTGKFRRATVIAAVTGRFLGFLVIFVGVAQVLNGNFLGGLWTAFIGWFLDGAAADQLERDVVQRLLGVHTVLDAMRRDVPRVSGGINLQELVDRYILPGRVSYTVVNGSNGDAGLITLSSIRKVPRYEWTTTKASEVMHPLNQLASTRPDAPLWSAFEEMGREGVKELPVVEGQSIVGVVSPEDIFDYLYLLKAFAE